jgi:hypothetical protein
MPVPQQPLKPKLVKEPARHVPRPVKPSADVKPASTKPLTISLNTAKISAQNIMNEFTMVVAEETPAQVKLLFTPKHGKVKLSSILRYAERIKSNIGPNVTFAGPFSEGDAGGLQVNISRVINIAARLTSSVHVSTPMLFDTLYSGIYHTLVEAAFKSNSDLEKSVYECMSVNSIDCSIAEHSVLRASGNPNMIEHLVALVQDWKNPKTIHYAHSSIPITLTTKAAKVQVAKGDPFSYRYDSSKNALYIALPAHGITKESEIIVTPMLQDWIIKSDPKSKQMFELVVSKEKAV